MHYFSFIIASIFIRNGMWNVLYEQDTNKWFSGAIDANESSVCFAFNTTSGSGPYAV